MKIYMCHSSIEKLLKSSQKWKELNPEYEIKLYDDKMCEEFLQTEYSEEHKNIFKFIVDGPIKADFWRICVINKYGGLYVDSDIMPLVPLKNFIENNIDFCTCISGIKKFNPQFIMSKANEEILINAIDKYINYYRNKKLYSYWGWSICDIMEIEDFDKEKRSRTFYNNGKKIQLLLEVITNKYTDHYCLYNNKRIMNNKFINKS